MHVTDITLRLLQDAGIGPGQRVLDLGCGYGDVSALAASLVGPDGFVLGVDRSPETLAHARERAAGRGLPNVRFVVADLEGFTLPDDALPAGRAAKGAFDAVIARRVLMYLADPARVLRGVLPYVRPGGLVVLQEHDATVMPAAVGAFPEHRRLHRIVWDTVAREGADLAFGFKLPAVLAAAGVTVEHVRADAVVTGPEGAWQQHHPLAAVVRGVAPRILATGAATESELGLDGLEARLAAELHDAGTPWIGDLAFGAWGRKP